MTKPASQFRYAPNVDPTTIVPITRINAMRAVTVWLIAFSLACWLASPKADALWVWVRS